MSKLDVREKKEKDEKCICKAISDSSYFGIMAVGLDGSLLYLNEAAKKIIDIHDDSNSSPRHLSEIDDESWNDFQKIIETGKPQLGVEIHFLSRQLLANRMPIKLNDEIIGVMSVFQDVETYEEIGKKITRYQQLAEEVEAIIESSYDGIYVTDGEANTIRINTAYENITGIKASEVIGRNMSELVDKGYYDESVTLNVLKTRKSMTINQTLKTGKEILVTGNPIFDENNDISMVVTNVRDMTNLVELTRQLEQSTALKGAYKERLQELQRSTAGNNDLVMVSEEMLHVYEMVERVCGTDATVLIYGETGVGKDRIAEEIHDKSPRSENGIFVKINCGAIPEMLLESELFGYESGAFTGAKREGKAGLFEVADGGTIFLDEVDSMPLVLQSKLLRVLQNFEITRVGGTKPNKVDVRLICATHQDLQNQIARKEFRADLYYRLNVVPIYIPPLRERRDDIPPLVSMFLSWYNRKHGKHKTLSRDVRDILREYAWPGNVREVSNLIERLVVVTPSNVICAHHLPPEFNGSSRLADLHPGTTLKEYLHEVEMKVIMDAVRNYGNARKAAPHLGVDPTTLTRKINKYKQKNGQ